MKFKIACAALLLALPITAYAQEVSQAEPVAAGETGAETPDPAKLKMPALAFAPNPMIEADYDKYFYFHRAGTSFAEAYADIKECDALASGISLYMGATMNPIMAQYGVLGTLMADAIFGSSERRRIRRENLRNCMFFKEYQRYGLTHELWDSFNFEEGMGRKREGVREQALQLQALVASGPMPQTKELGL